MQVSRSINLDPGPIPFSMRTFHDSNMLFYLFLVRDFLPAQASAHFPQLPIRCIFCPRVEHSNPMLKISLLRKVLQCGRVSHRESVQRSEPVRLMKALCEQRQNHPRG